MSTSDLYWADVDADLRDERAQRLVEQARVAASDVWPFLASATSREDYLNRKALADDRIVDAVSKVANGDPAIHATLYPQVVESFDEDFNTLHEAREREAFETAESERGRRGRDSVGRGRRELARARRSDKTAMLFMNEYDVQDALRRFDPNDTPNLYGAVTVLANLVDWANRNSDGWAYWPKPARAAKSLMGLIEGVDRWDPQDISDAELKRALSPIKAFFTREGFDGSEVLTTEGQRKQAYWGVVGYVYTPEGDKKYVTDDGELTDDKSQAAHFGFWESAEQAAWSVGKRLYGDEGRGGMGGVGGDGTWNYYAEYDYDDELGATSSQRKHAMNTLLLITDIPDRAWRESFNDWQGGQRRATEFVTSATDYEDALKRAAVVINDVVGTHDSDAVIEMLYDIGDLASEHGIDSISEGGDFDDWSDYVNKWQQAKNATTASRKTADGGVEDARRRGHRAGVAGGDLEVLLSKLKDSMTDEELQAFEEGFKDGKGFRSLTSTRKTAARCEECGGTIDRDDGSLSGWTHRNDDYNNHTAHPDVHSNSRYESSSKQAEFSRESLRWTEAVDKGLVKRGFDVEQLRRIVDNRQHEEAPGGGIIDMQSANAILTVYDALSEDNREKFASLPVGKAAEVAWKLVAPHQGSRGDGGDPPFAQAADGERVAAVGRRTKEAQEQPHKVRVTEVNEFGFAFGRLLNENDEETGTTLVFQPRGTVREGSIEWVLSEQVSSSYFESSVKEAQLHAHMFGSTSTAYNQCQVNDRIKDGDILAVPSEGVFGFLYQAWPIAVTEEYGEFHGTPDREAFLADNPQYAGAWDEAETLALQHGASIREASKHASHHTFSKFRIEVEAGSEAEAADSLKAMVRSAGGKDVRIERESSEGTVVVATSNDMSEVWTSDLSQRIRANSRWTNPTFEASKQAAGGQKGPPFESGDKVQVGSLHGEVVSYSDSRKLMDIRTDDGRVVEVSPAEAILVTSSRRPSSKLAAFRREAEDEVTWTATWMVGNETFEQPVPDDFIAQHTEWVQQTFPEASDLSYSRPNTPTEASLRKGAPFADYEDFDDCVSKNSDKDDPQAYCGKIKHQVEDSKESARKTAIRWEPLGDGEHLQGLTETGHVLDVSPDISGSGYYGVVEDPEGNVVYQTVADTMPTVAEDLSVFYGEDVVAPANERATEEYLFGGTPRMGAKV